MHKPGPNCITDAFCVNDAPLCCDDSCFPGRSPRGLWSGSSGSDHRWNSVAYSQNFSVCDGKCSENLNSVIASIWKIPYFEKDKPKGKIYLLVIKRLFFLVLSNFSTLSNVSNVSSFSIFSILSNFAHCSKSSFFVQNFNFDFSR